ncbi:MAG: BamA/TamA family outer membrane protein, partial [Acidobacteria bacterium]|nr:BamA/TamA family outer membrane protein [Acidobacteriota bacterium]
GQAIAFVTDRFTTNLDRLELGDLRLALIDPANQRIREMPAFDTGRHISPQWSPDGRRLYFIGSPNGIANVCRLEIAGGRPEVMTNLQTGVSGITASSPAFSVASSAGRVAFTVFTDNEYWIYTADSPEAIAPGATRLATGLNAAVLPPSRRADRTVEALLADSMLGLPPAQANFPVTEYDPALSLDYLGQPAIGIGVDNFGTYVGGGLSAFFSDMLGDHQVGATAHAAGSFDDLGGQLQYLNRSSRWLWGGAVEYMPYRFGSFAQSLATTTDGRQIVVEETLIERQTSAGGTGIVAYPFSRASRVEFAAGARHIGFSRELESQAFSLVTGELVAEAQEDLPAPDGLVFADAGAALVYDTSVFGATSPILGRRYRFDFTQTAGSLSYSGITADFRQYFMPVRPFTVALRALHFGRYGQDAEDVRLRSSYLGYPELVRGYEVGSFSVNECQPGPAGACQVFDQLIGSRLLVGNLELRFPPWGALGGDNFYGPIPIELALFADAGVAWDAVSSPAFADGDRELVKSVGAVARINVFGYAVAEINYVRPLDRPGKGWFWQFGLRQGF